MANKEKEETQHVQQGTVAFYSKKLKYGFITPEGEKEKENDVFFHKNGIALDGNGKAQTFKKGDKVSFLIQEISENEKGPVAMEIKKIEE